MAQKEHLGLCGICAHNADCVFITTRNMQHPVMYCEEFLTVFSDARAETRQSSTNNFSDDNRPPGGTLPDIDPGLCCDCKNRQACNLIAKPEGGVWYCEEYR